jgi:hypothetical protein
MADSRRETVFKKVETILNTVTGIGTVSRGKIDATAIQRYPAAFIYPGFDDVEEWLGDYIDRNMEVFIFGWCAAQSDVIPEIEAFLPKIQQALAADHTLTGTVIDFNETGVSERILTEEQTEGGFIINYQCKYRVRRDNPCS